MGTEEEVEAEVWIVDGMGCEAVEEVDVVVVIVVVAKVVIVGVVVQVVTVVVIGTLPSGSRNMESNPKAFPIVMSFVVRSFLSGGSVSITSMADTTLLDEEDDMAAKGLKGRGVLRGIFSQRSTGNSLTFGTY